ncbi:MAG: GTP 3',8-cyclase MoaA [Gammaproteobacteria bacterium]|nr:GTP 3',8-cyclase MoaA [Gammaproteobacteria bacterium]
MTQLIDQFKRPIEYVRLSVTDRCDLRCFYCMPEDHHEFQEPEEWLSFDEVERVIGAFTRLGVSRIRITGGEPLVRRNVDQLVKKLAVLPGLDDLSMSTNAVSLSRFAQPLYAAGVRRLNVSLDTLQAERFKTITKGKLDKVIKGLMAAKEAGFSPIKINMVVMKGINDDEVEDMVEFCLKHDFTLRFIETMPMGSSGLEATDHYQDLQEIKHRLQQRYDLIPGFMPGGGPARYYNIAGSKANIGFITPISQHFCDTCNRVRLSADGTLYMCLGQEHNFPLRPLLRAGISDHELENAIRAAIDLKPEKHEFNENPEQVVRFMSFTGG